MLNQPFVLEVLVNEQHRDFLKEADAYRKVRQAHSDPSRHAVRWNQLLVRLGENLVGRVRQLAHRDPLFTGGAYRQKRAQ